MAADRSFVSASELAHQLRVQMKTLAKWRRVGKGPRSFVYLSPTRVVYDVKSVEDYLASLPSTVRPAFVPPPRQKRVAS